MMMVLQGGAAALARLAAVAAFVLLAASASLAQERLAQPLVLPLSANRLAEVLRPAGPGPFPLALIVHGSDEDRRARARMAFPDYPGLAKLLLARGYGVVIAQRSGHGKAGGRYLEAQGGCARPDYVKAARATAAAIAEAVEHFEAQSWIKPGHTLVVGHSAGGLGALALGPASGVARIIVFAPGRGARSRGAAGALCAAGRLTRTVGSFGHSRNPPVLWLTAANDTYFTPEYSRQLRDAYAAKGARAEFTVLPAYGSEGHFAVKAQLADAPWRQAVEGFLELR